MLSDSEAKGIDLPRFLTRSDFIELMDPYTIVGDSGYAKGGTVYNPDRLKQMSAQFIAQIDMEANNG